MTITIYSGSSGWHVQDLFRACRELDIPANYQDFSSLHSQLGQDLVNNNRNDTAHIIRWIPAGSLEQITFWLHYFHMLYEQNKVVINKPRSIEVCVDKFMSSIRFRAAGIAHPETTVCQSIHDAMIAFDDYDRDIVVKPIFGSEGRGIVRISDSDTAWRVFHALVNHQQILYIQQYIDHPGWDLRVLTLAGEVVAAMRRVSRHWKTNIAQGATAEPYPCDSVVRELALQAAQSVEADLCGVDLIQDRAGRWYVLEVNAMPGWKALAAVCNIDVAKLIIEYAIRRVNS